LDKNPRVIQDEFNPAPRLSHPSGRILPLHSTARPIGGRQKWGKVMKIVIIGGTGLISTKLASRLREKGHDVLQASPSTGVNTLRK
jgi:hypothetical protein